MKIKIARKSLRYEREDLLKQEISRQLCWQIPKGSRYVIYKINRVRDYWVDFEGDIVVTTGEKTHYYSMIGSYDKVFDKAEVNVYKLAEQTGMNI